MNSPAVREARADLLISVALLGFCAFAAAQTAQLKVPAAATKAGPAFMPWIMVILISICAVLLLFRALKQQQAGNAALIELPSGAIWLKMLAFVLLMIAYAAALMPIGYIWTTMAVFAIGLLILGERNPLVLVIFPVLMTCAVYFGFTKLLAVWLP